MRRLTVASIALLTLFAFVRSADAATLVAITLEDSASDGVCDTTTCTLRDAVGDAGFGDTVELAPGTHHLASQVTIAHQLTVRGAAASSTAVESATGRVLQVFSLGDQPTVVLTGFTIRGATLNEPGATGGGLFVGPTPGTRVTLDGVVVSDNHVTGPAAASTVGGGGIGESGGNVLTLVNSTVSGNSAQKSGAGVARGGGIALDGGGLVLLNTTVTGNTAAGDYGVSAFGGGIYANDGDEDVQMRFVTLASNTTSGEGGNIYTEIGAGGEVAATIIADGAGAAGHTNCGGDTLADEGLNLESTDECGLGDEVLSFVNTPVALGPLQLNSGRTPTRLPAPSSAAVDAAGPLGDDEICGVTLGRDQRGALRAGGPACDIGAVELRAPTATIRPAAAVTTSAATLVGAINAYFGPMSYHFEYGPTAALGSVSPTQSNAFGGRREPGGREVTADIAGLQPGTTYHFRLVGESGEGAVVTGATSFTTEAEPVVAGPGGEQPAPPGGGPDPSPGAVPIAPRLAGLSLKPARFRLGSRTSVTFQLAGAGGSVDFSLAKLISGRRLGTRCVRNGRGRPCTRVVPLAGSMARTGQVGANSFRFSGRLGATARSLTPGRYRLTAKIGASTRSVTFKVLPRRGA